MLFVLPWVCLFIAAGALAELIHDYVKECKELEEEGNGYDY